MNARRRDESAGSDEIEEEVVPRPSALIESLRSFGYTPATAVADLIDNSITAGATKVEVRFEWQGPASSVVIADNGRGMTEDELRDAMRAGSRSPLDERAKGDLGRFGLGLKTASFSQARSLTVASRPLARPVAVRRWDLDHVGRVNRWSLMTTPPPQAQGEIAALEETSSGTMVLWHDLDRVVDDRPATDDAARSGFFATVDRVKEHLEMVFHRFISSGLSITVNGQVCEPWDPFMTTHRATELLPSESKKVALPDGSVNTLKIQPFVLPHRSALTAAEHRAGGGPRGWNLQQGFYLYRADRLIVPGDWFDPQMKPEEHHKLARIRVEITQGMDHDWALDVRKSKGRPPSALRKDFQRIARATRERAVDVYRHHGRHVVAQTTPRGIPITPVWRIEMNDQVVRFRVNRSHPTLEQLLLGVKPKVRRRIASTLALIETNVPVERILSQGYADEGSLPDASASPSGAEIIDELYELFEARCAAGYSESEAKAYLITLQPFDRLPELVASLEREDKS